jgi:dolichol-phosphate mannosyltransferase
MRNLLLPLVIIPTYNERDNVSEIIPAILGTDARLHILIVDDSSPDNTAAEVKKLAKTDCAGRVFLMTRPGKLGLGSAYVQGFKWGLERGYDFLIQMDADWSHNPNDLSSMLRFAEAFDFVIGSRYVDGGGTSNWDLKRKLLSRSASVYSRMVLKSDFADFTGGFNGWSGEVLETIGVDGLQSDGYSFQMELKYRADQLGFTHTEFPIIFTERRAGKSKMSISIALEACWRVWQFRLARQKAGVKTEFQNRPVIDRQS